MDLLKRAGEYCRFHALHWHCPPITPPWEENLSCQIDQQKSGNWGLKLMLFACTLVNRSLKSDILTSRDILWVRVHLYCTQSVHARQLCQDLEGPSCQCIYYLAVKCNVVKTSHSVVQPT